MVGIGISMVWRQLRIYYNSAFNRENERVCMNVCASVLSAAAGSSKLSDITMTVTHCING